jgi:hypothetical protein
MKITRSMMNKAVEEKIISQEQAKNLIQFIKNWSNQSPGFNLTNVLYYFGGLIAIGAMTLFMNLGWELYGGWGIVFLCFCYAILSLALTHKLDRLGFTIPAGICATFVVCLTPLGIYGFQLAMGWWPGTYAYQDYHVYIKWHWLFMELGTLAVGIILAWIYRYPFMIMPIALTLWYLSMDLASMISGEGFSFELNALVSLYFGLVVLLIAFWVDVRSSQVGDYAFWLYIVGVLIFWGGISSQNSAGELSRFLYLCMNLILILVGVILSRKVFVIFGALGVCSYLSYLAFQVFQFSYLFPVALSTIGFGIIYLGILWQRNEIVITKKMRTILPKPLQDLFQARDNLE